MAHVSKHEPKFPLIIDPAYQWHTFYCGAPDQQVYALTVDAQEKSTFVVTSYSI